MAVAKRIEGALRARRHRRAPRRRRVHAPARGHRRRSEAPRSSPSACRRRSPRRSHVGDRELYVSASIGIACPAPDARRRSGAQRRRRHVPRPRPGRRAAAVFDERDARAEISAWSSRPACAAAHRAPELRGRTTSRWSAEHRRDRRLRGAVPLDATRRDGDRPPTGSSPLAEETGLIVRSGAWVLERGVPPARELARRTRAAGSSRSAVNISARQLADPGFVDVVPARWPTRARPARAAGSRWRRAR